MILKKYLDQDQKLINQLFAIPSINWFGLCLLNLLKYSKELLIANKESIICGGKILINEVHKK